MKALHVTNREEWRSWLEKNGKSCQEICLIYYKKSSGKPAIAYDHAVEEALCFGWIDGKTVRVDEERYGQRFTPRNPKSRWSPINIRRAKRLIKEGKMTEAGLVVFDPSRKTEAQPSELPDDLERKFRARAGAWKNFQQFPPYYRRMTAGWVGSAKKEETRRKRLEKLMEFSGRNQRIKFM
jgi:uncharacterized protein YdeI (YjbR/CyaY-like superfamily)